MKILLINPWDSEVFPTPAIGYLQATVKAHGHEVKAVDLSGIDSENDDYDFIAASFHSFSVRYAIRIREKFKGHLICGGHHPSSMPHQMLGIGYNQVVVGEGEQALIDIIEGNTSQIINGKQCNIDAIPIPDYTGLSYSGLMGMPIISSRGCPFHCNFCASTRFWGNKYRMRSSDSVLNELAYRINGGMRVWMFEDDNFTANKHRAMEICSGIAEMGKFSWQCASRAESLDDELCRALSLAGCKTVWLGIESLCQDSLDRCNKHTTVAKMLNGIKTAHKYGIETISQFITGIPGDSIENIQETAFQIRKNKIGTRGANIMWILPDTLAYYKAKERGFSDETYLKTGAPFYTYEQDMNTLNKWSNLINVA